MGSTKGNLMNHLYFSGLRLMTIGNIIIFSAALLAILSKGSLSAGQAGLSITSSLQIVGALVWVVRYGNSGCGILRL